MWKYFNTLILFIEDCWLIFSSLQPGVFDELPALKVVWVSFPQAPASFLGQEGDT